MSFENERCSECSWGYLPALVLVNLVSILSALESACLRGANRGDVPHAAAKVLAPLRLVNKHWCSSVTASWSTLTFKGPSDKLLAVLSKLPHLRYLDLTKTQTRVSSDWLPACSRHLALPSLPKSHSLVELRTKGLTKEDTLILSKMSSLRALDLEWVDMRHISFASLTQLEKLTVEFGGPVSTTGFQALGCMRNLTSLELWYNGMPALMQGEPLSGLTKLTHLVLSRCLKGGGTSDLAFTSGLVNLKSLQLPKCRITDDMLGGLASLTKLTHLDLSESKPFRGMGLTVLLLMPELREVRLCGTSIAELGTIGKLERLSRLDVSGCSMIHDDDLLKLTNLKSLSSMDLSWCDALTMGGVDAFSSLLELEVNFRHYTDNYVGLLV